MNRYKVEVSYIDLFKVTTFETIEIEADNSYLAVAQVVADITEENCCLSENDYCTITKYTSVTVTELE